VTRNIEGPKEDIVSQGTAGRAGRATVDQADGRGEAVVVLGGPAPDWLRAWCAETGRRLELRPDIEIGSAAPLIATAPSDHDLAGSTVWVAHEVPDRAPRRIVVALRRLPEEADVLDEAISAADYLDGSLLIAHAVPLSFAERSVGLDAAVADGHRLLVAATEAAASRLPGNRVSHSLVRSHPHELVIEPLHADLLILGGPRPGQLAGPGVVRRSALHHAPCPILVVPKRSGR
jgi:hypothetical protein